MCFSINKQKYKSISDNSQKTIVKKNRNVLLCLWIVFPQKTEKILEKVNGTSPSSFSLAM